MPELIDIRQAFEAGGSVEGSHGSEGTKDIQVYTDNSGKQTLYSSSNTAPKNPTPSITIDKDSGKITISAPQNVLDDPSFEEIFSTDVLKQFSSAYQRNKDFKLPDPFEQEDETKDITIPELVDKYSQHLKDFTEALKSEQDYRNSIDKGETGYSNRKDIAKRLTRNDFITMSTNALGEGANDDALISIPKSMYEDVNFLESFDPVKGTVKKGDFREKVFSLKEKDENYIHSLYNRLEEYFEEDDFEDTDEYARATALYSFLQNNDPDANPLQISNYVVSDLFKGAGLSLRESLVGLVNLASTIFSAGGRTSGPINSLREFTEKGLEDIEKEKQEAEDFIGELSTAGKTALTVGGIGESIAEILIPAGIAGSAARGATVAKMTSKARKGAQAAEDLSKIALTGAATAENLATGADLLIAANNASKAADIGAAAARAAMAAKSTKVVSTVADLAAQTITEAVVYDPVVFSKILQKQEKNGIQASTSDDAYGYLLETAAWNIAGWGAFTVGAKGIKSFGKTKAGRYTNAVAQKYLSKVSVATGSLGENILKLRYGDDWLNGAKSAQKNEARKYNYELRQAQKSVASQKIGAPFAEGTWKNVIKQEENIIEMMSLHNATDAMQRGAKAYIRKMLNARVNPTLSGYEQKLRALGSKITKAERKAGLSTRRKVFRVKDNDVVRVFSKESANYIGARTQLDILENIKRIRGGLTDVQKKSEEILERMLAESKSKLPKEIQDYLEEYLSWDRKFWQEYNNLRMTEGSLSTRQIEELRAEGYWGENGELYRPSYRVDPNRESKLVRNDDRVVRDNDTATEQFVWGSEKDFMDPEVARYVAMSDAGSILNATRYIEAVNAVPSSKAHVVHDAEEVARAQRMKDIRIPLNARIKSATKGVFRSGEISTGKSAKRATRLYTMRANWVKQAGKTEEAELALARASTKKIKPTITEKRSAVGAMTQSQLDDVFTEAGITLDFSRMRSQDEFEAFYNSLDKTTQKYLQQKMGNVAGILYPAETGEDLLERAVEKSAIKSGIKESSEVKNWKNQISDAEKRLKEYTPQNDAIETISQMKYSDRSRFARDVVSDSNGEYILLYRVQNGSPDKWRPNNRGIPGKFQAHGKESGMDGAVWLTADKEWAEGPSRATAGVEKATNENIVVIPVKKSDILNLNRETLAKEELEKSGKKIVKTRGVNNGLEKSEYILWENEHPEIFDEGMELMLKKRNEWVDKSPAHKRLARKIQEEIDTLNKALDTQIDDEIRNIIGQQSGVAKNAPYITAENYNKLARLDSSFVPDLKKSLVQNRIDLRDSAAVTKAAEEARRAKLISEREGLYKENFAELNRLSKEGLKIKDEDAILAEFDLGINEYLEEVYSDKKLAQTIDDIIEQSGTVDKEAAREYIVLEEMLRDEGQEFREIRQVARDGLKGNSEKEKISDMFERMFEDKVYDRRNIARQKLVDEESTLVDRKSWMEEIRKADQEITGKLSEPGYISMPNARGEMEVWEVDPVAADLYNYAARQPGMGKVAKFFNETSKIFRLNTTGLNIMSYVNQSFRDFGNLWLTSGSYHTIGLSRAEMIDMFGPEIANWYLREEPEVYEQLIKLAERQGRPIETLVVERELAMGREISTQATETALLKTVGDSSKVTKIKRGELNRTSQWIDRGVDLLSTPNEWRERYFRNIVYADSLNQALKRGYTLKSARIQAEFMMNNATTNFSRELVHLQALQRTVPYLGAAVNGSKSFWRIFSLDPVGVMSRFMGGFVIPTMALTGLALANPDTRKKYEQLNEYEKDNNIIVPIDGNLLKIPIPQEVSPLVKPWQHLVEKMYGSNRHDFWELMLNDALGISPMDITGFYDLDQDAMENPTIWDRLNNGVAQLVWGQMSPPPVKAAYMLATGTDPYTGKFIDTSYQYYDYESGEVLVMDSSQSAFSQVMAKVFGGSASVLAATLNAVLGRTGLDVLDAITTAAQYAVPGGEEGSLTTIFEQIGESISKPITVADYDRTKTAWNREISKLYRKKESIQNNPRFKEIEDAINVETDPQKLKSLKADRADMLEDWYEEIKVAINKFQDNFGGTIDRFRMASLLSLLNMYESTGGLGAPGRAANDDLFNEGRSEAIRTLIDMGVSATGDRSILGYMTNVRHKDGTESTEVKFYKPLEILAMQNAWYDKANVNVSYIEELLEDGAINYKDKLRQVKKLRQQIFDKGKLSQADRSDISALELNWNAEVMQVLAPYFERVTPESAINDEKVMEYLDDFILIPSEFKKDKRGRYVTNKYLGEGNANDAYIKNYIRKIFEINDTGYSTGKNYSGRQSLGG